MFLKIGMRSGRHGAGTRREGSLMSIHAKTAGSTVQNPAVQFSKVLGGIAPANFRIARHLDSVEISRLNSWHGVAAQATASTEHQTNRGWRLKLAACEWLPPAIQQPTAAGWRITARGARRQA